ncbi:MAG: HAD family hydrolase [Patescibacteria group bacterium]
MYSHKSLKSIQAILFDIDGTLIAGARTPPTQCVRDAVQHAQEKGIFISVVTGREIHAFESVNEWLSITAPVVLAGGARLYDPQKRKDLWTCYLNAPEAKELISLLLGQNAAFYAHTGRIMFDSSAYAQLYANLVKEPLEQGRIPRMRTPLKVLTPAVHSSLDYTKFTYLVWYLKPGALDEARRILHQFSDIAYAVVRSTHKEIRNAGMVGIYITHSQATKQHGVFELSKVTGVPLQNIVGVGNDENDFPLLMACGYKVAMGNAVSSLKEIADYIAPPVEEDGAVQVIEKILKMQDAG